MERRLLLVFALTFLVIILFQPVLKRYLPQPTTPAPQAQKQAQVPPTQTPSAVTPSVAVPQKPASLAAKQASSETEAVIENDLYRITFSNRGARVKSWVLKKFDDKQGKPLDLVNARAAEKYGYPLSLWAYDETLRNKLNSLLYAPSRAGALPAPAEITFEYAGQDLSVRKTFRFDHTYVVGVETSVSSKGSQVTALPMWPAGLGDETNLASYHSSQIEYQNNSKIERLAIKKISSGNTLNGPFNWAGVTDSYFAATFLPDDPQASSLVTLRNALDIPKDPKDQNSKETINVEVLGAAVGNLKGPTTERIYAGPKALQIVEAVPVPSITGAPQDLRGLVNFGFFGIIARPLFLWLKWTHDHWSPTGAGRLSFRR